MKDKEEKTTQLWLDWQNSVNYMNSLELPNKIEKNWDYYEGRQWKDGNSFGLQKVQMNFVEMVVNSKTANITSNRIRPVFFSDENEEAGKVLTNFNDFVERKQKFNENCPSIVKEASVAGSRLVHFYFDNSCINGIHKFELIDALNFGVHNPKEIDIQKQKWVIIHSRKSLDEVKALCEIKQNEDSIVEDDNFDNSNLKIYAEQDDSKLVTVLTKYFKDKYGEVMFERATRTVRLHGPRYLNPYLNKIDNKKQTETEQIEQNIDATKLKADLYPLAIYQYKERKNCIYGRGEVETLIPNNRALNFNYAMMCKAVESNGINQIAAKEGAFNSGDTINNDPTKILIDRYKGPSAGYYILQKQPFSNQSINLNDSILQTTRSVTGATEVMTGELARANQSGVSIAYLQQQAQVPLNDLTERYKRFRERVAEINLMFYKLFYDNISYTYEQDEAELPAGSQQEENTSIFSAMKANQQIKKRYNQDTFNGKMYVDLSFSVKIEATAASTWTEITEIQLLEYALQNGQIDYETFIKNYPVSLLQNKSALIKAIKEKKQEQILALSQQLEQAKQFIQESQEKVNSADTLIAQNKKLKETLLRLQDEYTQKIQIANAANKNERDRADKLQMLANETQITLQKVLSGQSV